MWPFSRKDKSQKKLIKKIVSRYTGEKKLDLILTSQNHTELIPMHVDFVLILISQDSDPSQPIHDVSNTIQEHDGMIESMTSTLITVYFGVPDKQPNSKRMRIGLVGDLLEKFGANLSIIHGACECPVGSIGNEKRKAYTALLPDYKAKLRELSGLPFGQTKEV